MRIKNNIWIISDTHFGHDNIIKFQQRPKNHESLMLSNWIKCVKEEDTILHLGDFCMAKGVEVAKNWCYIAGRLPGKKYLILGNHDKETGPVYRAYEDITGFNIIPEFIQNKVAFTHRPITSSYQIEGEWEVNIHGHVHGNSINPDIDGMAYGKKYINMCVEVQNYMPRQVGNIITWDWRINEEC